MSDPEFTEPGAEFPAMNAELLAKIIEQGVKPEQVSTRYSDVIVLFPDAVAAANLRGAGPWRSMANVFKTNPEHPDAKKWPWGCDIPFGCLDARLGEMRKESKP